MERQWPFRGWWIWSSMGGKTSVLVIFSDSLENHIKHLKRVLRTIQQTGLTLNNAKRDLAKQKTRYLRNQLGQGQVDKVEVILTCSRPKPKRWFSPSWVKLGGITVLYPSLQPLLPHLLHLPPKTRKTCYLDWRMKKAFKTIKNIFVHL